MSFTINGLVIDPQGSQTLYAGAEVGVYRSEDGGNNWARAGLPDSAVSVLVIDPQTPQQLYAGTNEGVYKSGDGADSWKKVSTGLPDTPVTSLVIDPQSPQRLYASTDGETYMSVNGGESWTPVNAGLTDIRVFVLELDSQDSRTLYAGTSAGVCSITFPDITAIVEEHTESVPRAFTLDQNYPNPFNSSTVIQYGLPQRGRVELALYNLAGQQVGTLADGARQAGSYSVHWDGRGDAGRELGTSPPP